MPASSRRALRTAALLAATAVIGAAAWNPPPASAAAHPHPRAIHGGTAAHPRLVVTHGGTAAHPAVYDGHGRTVAGITVEANHVIVEDYRVTRPEAPGIEITGRDITVRRNTVTSPHGGDGDGMRFFGDDLKIQRNTVRGTSNRYGHADCMQTFASDTPPSRHVLIEGNRCEHVDNMCVMAEGPDDGEGDGHGHTSDFLVRDNYCETRKASQALMFEDVQHVTIVGNTFAAPTDHAVGLAIHSTGAHVCGNRTNSRVRYEVGIDASSRPGYRGPKPGGAPWRRT
ncbi:right-handed parallel beta-helix repeat-containing protein [Streptomyces yokosukanensis]|uniref:right-handed parallel beta-helix repeat-containing protein n=1 Tax=Streptomyces yokosukanensis TaxID=67386 RepID=UPI000832A5C4|nr:right-handed parallel beta-helix repeat-containing protein [Streptomyces yokosukanensis]